ncbi:hypothetical protein TNCV_520381 [Trichonephila clavipes]|nr:hypothetical protein TNCV_520381 [Trichonephila clavipes]
MKAGWSAMRVARQLGRSDCAVRRCWNQWIRKMSFTQRPSSGRPRKTPSGRLSHPELAERWTELPQVSDESRSFFRVHTGYFSNIPKCIKAEFIASWACSQSSVVSSSKR